MDRAREATVYEDPEGAGDPQEGDWGENYPLDAFFVRTEPRSVGDVVQRIRNNRYILDPEFQRDFVWPVAKQSKLIESCIMRIPLPVFYVAEAKDGRIIVVDGLQRLNTFYRFIDNEFKLTNIRIGSSYKHPLEGKYFRDFPVQLQERVSDTPLTMYILDSKAPEHARLEIFERVNSGVELTRQQMRNALYNGPATRWLKDAASSDEFRKATDSSLNAKQMRDREAINRFCAFKLLGVDAYKGDMDSFLAKGLVQLSDKSDIERKELLLDFKTATHLNTELFGEHAFRRSLASGAVRSPINISLYEVCMVSMSDLNVLDVNQKECLRQSIVKLLANDQFINAITYSTNSSRQVRSRFSLMKDGVALISGYKK